ncbi:MAG: hypothetical protein IT435_05400 [Phycisphaerales bacterium]|nr:hypothetical protein [Phycisphaerales bacterium]
MVRWVFVAYSILFILGEADTKRIVLLACWALFASAEEVGAAIKKRGQW